MPTGWNVCCSYFFFNRTANCSAWIPDTGYQVVQVCVGLWETSLFCSVFTTMLMNYSIKFYVTPSQKQIPNSHWERTYNNLNFHCGLADSSQRLYVILNGIDLMWWNERRKTVQLLIVATTYYYKTFFIHSIDSRAQGLSVVVFACASLFYLIENWWKPIF